MSPKRRLSLCMIAKDEQGNLPKCLERVKPIVDEIFLFRGNPIFFSLTPPPSNSMCIASSKFSTERWKELRPRIKKHRNARR